MSHSRLAALVALAASTLAAQHQHHGRAPAGPAQLLPGMGNWEHKIDTRSPEAQKFFNQGLALLYGFNRGEARRSFERAAQLDPQAAMPHWGIAASIGPYINMDMEPPVEWKTVCSHLETGRKLVRQERERAYLDAFASRCPAGNDDAFSAAMKKLVDRYPDDLDAAAFYADSLMIPVRWAWWKKDGTPNGRMAEAVEVLEGILRREPYHAGANHFYIHAVEMSPTPERAIPASERLMGIVPGAGHLVHMPGHIWMRVGDFDQVVASNIRAVDVDRAYFKQRGEVPGDYAGYYAHNVHFVAIGYQMLGDLANSRRWAAELAAEMAKAMSGMPPEMISMGDPFLAMPTVAELRFGQWEAILKLPLLAEKQQGGRAMQHFARAIAFHKLGRAAEAARERETFARMRAKIPAEWSWLNNKTSAILAVAAEVLEARLAPSESGALPHWRKALELEAGLTYDEPSPWFYPIRESLGAALLRSGDAPAAEQVFREGIAQTPRNGRMLFGLMESLKAQNRADAAALVEREFKTAWRRADTKLSIQTL